MQDKSLGVINFPSIAHKGLVSKVNVKLAEGWRPQGGVHSMHGEEGEHLFMQAIVLKTCECDPLPEPEPQFE
jgi:hypothetical protein|tara:strand:- start:86 stop:301 length:216 start_codon:yes stop_codon:yes gene_type:complete